MINLILIIVMHEKHTAAVHFTVRRAERQAGMYVTAVTSRRILEGSYDTNTHTHTHKHRYTYRGSYTRTPEAPCAALLLEG